MGNQEKNQDMLDQVFAFFKNMNKQLDSMSKQIDRLDDDVKKIKAHIEFLESRTDAPIELPDWIDTKTALKMLNLKDADTLRKYAKKGLIIQQRGADRRNYYAKEQIKGLAEILINQSTKA